MFIVSSFSIRRCIVACVLVILMCWGKSGISWWTIVSFCAALLSSAEYHHCILLRLQFLYQYELLQERDFATILMLLPNHHPTFFNWICFSRATRVCSLTRWWNKLLVMLTPLMSSIVGQQGHIKTIGRFVPSCSWKSTGIWSASIFNSASINNLALTLSSWWPFTHLNPRGSSSTTFY